MEIGPLVTNPRCESYQLVLLYFTEHDIVCGAILNTTTGSFMSPRLVDSDGTELIMYGFYEDCVWVLSGEKESVILLTFLYFELEWSPKCKSDFVEVSIFRSFYTVCRYFINSWHNLPPCRPQVINCSINFFFQNHLVNKNIHLLFPNYVLHSRS